MIKRRINELVNIFIEEIDVKPGSRYSYKRKINYFISFLQEEGIKKPCYMDVIAYKEKLEKLGLKASTIHAYIQAVKSLFKWLAKNGLYEDICAKIKNVKVSKEHKRDCLTARQVNQILESIDLGSISGRRDYALVSLMSVTGIREISVIKANIGDIMELGGDKVLFYQGKGKIDKSDYVKLTKPVCNAIDIYLRDRGSFCNKDPLFVSYAIRNKGGRLTTRSVSRIIKKTF